MPGPAPPVLARVLRGDRIESAHRGSLAVVDEDGRLTASCGDPDLPVYLRSAAKPFQAMPLLEAGGERAFRLGNDEIALMCASHGGEPRHVRTARRILARGRFAVSDLACGAHPPMHEPSARALLIRGEKPTALHNNCSGKHAGLLLACRLLGFDPATYFETGNPLHGEILTRISVFSGVPPGGIQLAVDGCGLPVFRLPLSGLARAYAVLAAASRARAGVSRRVVVAMCASPGMVAGKGRFTTELIEAGGGAWIGKEGAEGVYAIGLVPRKGAPALGLAFKIEDGSGRSREPVALDALALLGRLPGAARTRLARWIAPVVRSVAGKPVGEVRANLSSVLEFHER